MCATVMMFVFTIVLVAFLQYYEIIPCPRIYALEIQSLDWSNSVILADESHLCIPHTYTYLRGRMNYGAAFKKVHEDMALVNAFLGKYGTKNEPYAYVYKRICTDTQKSGEQCPLSSVIELKGKPADSRHSLLAQMAEMDMDVARIISLWDTYNLRYSSLISSITVDTMSDATKWPADVRDKDSSDITTIQTNKVIYPRMSDDIKVSLLFLANNTITNGALVFPDATTAADDFGKEIEQLNMNVAEAAFTLEMIIDLTDDLTNGIFPDYLFPISTWLPQWMSQKYVQLSEEGKKVLQQTLRNIIRRNPLTAVRKHQNCEPVDKLEEMPANCVLDIITLLPDVAGMTKLIQQKPIPVPLPTVINGTEIWEQVKLPDSTRIYEENNTYFSARKDPVCFDKKPNQDCQLCSAEVALEALTDPCLLQVTQAKVSVPPCAKENVTGSDSIHTAEVTQLRKNQEVKFTEIIVTNNDSSAITEVCDGKEITKPIPNHARILITGGCTFKFTNGPDVKELFPNMDWTDTKLPISKPAIVTIHKTVDYFYPVEQHFGQYGHIYIISFTVFLVVYLTGRCLMKCWSIKYMRFRHHPANITRLESLDQEFERGGPAQQALVPYTTPSSYPVPQPPRVT
jgi:hypothetical protein